MNIRQSFTLLLWLGVALPVAAQTAPDARLRDQLRQTTLQLRQLQDENSGLKAQVETLGKQALAVPVVAEPKVDDAELQALRAKLRQEQVRAADLQQKLEAVESNLTAWKQSYDQAVSLAKTRDADAKRLESQGEQTLVAHQQTVSALQACVADNASLVQIGNELIGRYRDKGVWSAVRDKEPLLGLTKLEFEKLAQDYRGRIADHTVSVPPVNPESHP